MGASQRRECEVLVKKHPTWIIGNVEPGPDTVLWRHAKLWLVVELPAWDARRSGHFHVVSRVDWPVSDWRPTSIARHPMRPEAAGAPTTAPDSEVIAGLEHWLRSWRPELYRQPEIGLVSELGEGEGAFRKRLLGGVRPELRRRVESLDHDTDDRQQLATGVAQLATAIESHSVADVTQAIQHIEIGLVIAPTDLDLVRQRPRHDLML